MNTEPIIVHQEVKGSLTDVWNAITQHDQMIKWYFENIPTFKAERGFKTSFPVSSEERTFTHLWEVIDVKTNKSITYSWKFVEYHGEGQVTFELAEKPESILVTLRNEGLHTFPQDMPEFTRESCRGGWEYFLGRLRDYMAQ